MTVEFITELNCIFSPAMAVPMTVKMPEPITAPIPSEVRLSQPSDFLSRFSGRSESEISWSMLLVRKSCGSNRHLPLDCALEGNCTLPENSTQPPRQGELGSLKNPPRTLCLARLTNGNCLIFTLLSGDILPCHLPGLEISTRVLAKSARYPPSGYLASGSGRWRGLRGPAVRSPG